MASLKNARSAVDNLVADLKKEQTASVIVQSAEELNDGFARVVATVTHANGSRTSKPAMIEALRKKFDNKLFPVEGSFRSLSSNPISDTVVGILSVAPQAISYTENMDGFKILAGNMFMDEEEHLWALKKTEAGEILVKSFGKDDAEVVSGLLESVCSSGFAAAYESTSAVQQTDAMLREIQGGDFITYVDPHSGQVSFGAVVATVHNENGDDTGNLYVADKDAGPAQVLNRKMVLASWDANGIELPEVDMGQEIATHEATAKSAEEIAAYYQKVFQKDPSYFQKFMERWNSHAFM